MIDRRGFLCIGAAATVGLGRLDAFAQNAPATDPRTRRYVRLGRTELSISDISFGSASSSAPELVSHALERGVNYFDTAESYRWGNSEEAIGQALQSRRSQVFLASKSKAGSSDTRAE